jgi:nucleotide-binding universal stress UspA family protein
MSKILACTDGSLYSPSVYKHTAWAAKRMDATVEVLHMLNPHHEKPVKSDYSGSIGFGAKSALLDELVELEAANARIAQKRGQAILEDAETVLRAEGLERIETMQKHGKLSDEIGTYESGADLVVIGKRGNNADFEKGHLGSNLERVIRSCQHPVLVASREFKQPDNFLLAYDGGKSAQLALDYLIEEPLLRGLKCHLVSVGNAKDFQKQNEAAATKLQDAGIEVEAAIIPGSPEEGLVEFVNSHSVDLVMMGAYGHSQIRQMIVGSTTTRIMRAVRHPVLLFR